MMKCQFFCLSYKDNNTGISIPRVSDANKKRTLYENACKSKSNALNTISKQALDFYNAHKGDRDFPMVLKEYIFDTKYIDDSSISH